MYNERVMLHKLHQARETINAGVGGRGVFLSKRDCESIVMAIDEAVRRLANAGEEIREDEELYSENTH